VSELFILEHMNKSCRDFDRFVFLILHGTSYVVHKGRYIVSGTMQALSKQIPDLMINSFVSTCTYVYVHMCVCIHVHMSLIVLTHLGNVASI